MWRIWIFNSFFKCPLYIYIKVYEHECRLCADTRVRHYKTIPIAHAQRALSLSLSLSHKFQLEIYVLVNHRNSWEWDLRVFWVNIAKSEVNLRYSYCSKLFGILRREIEFRYYRCRNSTKSMREKKKKVERENVEFRQRWYRISSAQFCCPCVECPKWKGKNKKNKIWQTNCGNAIAEIGV